jgi:hypothetical protein
MAVGIPSADLDARLAAFDGSFVQLHSGDPGADGTANVSTATTVRKEVTLAAPDTSTTNRRRRNDGIIRWEGTDVTGTQTNTHASLWTLVSAGAFQRSFALDAPVDLVTDTPAEIPINGLVLLEGPQAS